MAALAPGDASPPSRAGPAAQVPPHWVVAPSQEEALAAFLLQVGFASNLEMKNTA